MILEKTKIYGVEGIGTKGGSLIRTDDAAELSAGVVDGKIQSDFDRCYPWSDITEVTDRHGNVFMKIPKFYSRITPCTGEMNGYHDPLYKLQISGLRYEGFSTLFVNEFGEEIDYVLVGKYEASGDIQVYGADNYYGEIFSKSGKPVVTGFDIDTMFMCIRSQYGDGYCSYDIWIDAIIKQLFTVEFATTDSKSILIGKLSGTAALRTGRTDNVEQPTGGNVADGINGLLDDGAIKYRGIENPWGNCRVFCGGIKFESTLSDSSIERFNAEIRYSHAITLPGADSSREQKIIAVDRVPRFPLLLLPMRTQSYMYGPYTFFDGSYHRSVGNESVRYLFVGGGFGDVTNPSGSVIGGGLWNFCIGGYSASANATCRLCYKPT